MSLSLPAGHEVLGTEMQQITDLVNASAGAWTPWTPTLTNLTLGNGTVTARYLQVGKTVSFVFRFFLGTTSVVGTHPMFTLPVAPTGNYVGSTGFQVGDGILFRTGAATKRAVAEVASGLTATIYYLDTAGNVDADVTATVPWTWASGHALTVGGTYEVP